MSTRKTQSKSNKNNANKLKNGLSITQVNKAKQIFSKVNLSQIAKDKEVNVSTVNNVLRGTSSNMSAFRLVLIEAKKQVAQKEKALKALPL